MWRRFSPTSANKSLLHNDIIWKYYSYRYSYSNRYRDWKAVRAEREILKYISALLQARARKPIERGCAWSSAIYTGYIQQGAASKGRRLNHAIRGSCDTMLFYSCFYGYYILFVRS